ncbi:unnamed protein product [Ilex paraguariensis]|uniref:Uncharacterized protein n=1 Tax=Ilex paraguariensis TaxID=185542 RepID=A0ABC8SH02_9AQUA
MGDSAVAKRKGRENRSNLHQSEPVSGDGQKVVMPVGFKGLAESSEHDKRQISIDIRITSPERGFQQRDGDDRTRAPNQVDIRKDAITKRKQQREAVDALLSSALISSKKTEISSKPVTAMRHLPPTNTAGHAIKPPKPRKGSKSNDAELSDDTLMALRYLELADQRKNDRPKFKKENSDDRSRNLKHAEKVKRSSRHAELQHKNAKHSYERKRKYMITETQSAYSAGGDEHDCLATGDAFKGKKRRAREEHDSVAKMDLTSVAGNRVNEDMKSTSTGDQVIDRVYEVKKTNEKLLSMGDSAVAKRKGRENRSNLHQSEPVSGDGQKVVMPVGFKGLAESSEHDKRQISIDIRITSPERGFQQRDGDDRTRAPNQVDIRKDAITKRKQQREAVDALLSSALISSKKTEISSKPVTAMRHLPPTNTAGHAIKPPKPRKGNCLPISTSMEHLQVWESISVGIVFITFISYIFPTR